MFEGLSVHDSRPLAALKKSILIFLALFLVIGAVSSHRAYYQVRGVELHADSNLRAGSSIVTNVVSSGRTHVDVRIELVQGTRAETLAEYRVASNEYAFFDPRTQRATQTVVIAPAVLARFDEGPALLRATANGRSQWTRIPPPVVRELAVNIQHE